MRILFVADGRSPIALNWIEYFVNRGDEVHLASTFPCKPVMNLASLSFYSVGFSQIRSDSILGKRRLWGNAGVRSRTILRQWIAPLTLPAAAGQLNKLIQHIRPELVHAMRIPFEGMLAAKALHEITDIPLLVSVWGNDFTLHARATPVLRGFTRNVIRRMSGLHTDCERDRRLAFQWGFPERKPSLVGPGNGGIKLNIFYPPERFFPERECRVINPRGFRAYVRNDAFFQAIPQVLVSFPKAEFLCPDMAAHQKALRWISKFSLEGSIRLLPTLSQSEMAEAFRRSAISVSPSTHDGTPNTLLEAMASGCFPVAGDLESIREWITPGVNGLLVDPNNPWDIAEKLVSALSNQEMRRQGAEINRQLIRDRAEYHQVMGRVIEFYQTLLQ